MKHRFQDFSLENLFSRQYDLPWLTLGHPQTKDLRFCIIPYSGLLFWQLCLVFIIRFFVHLYLDTEFPSFCLLKWNFEHSCYLLQIINYVPHWKLLLRSRGILFYNLFPSICQHFRVYGYPAIMSSVLGSIT